MMRRNIGEKKMEIVTGLIGIAWLQMFLASPAAQLLLVYMIWCLVAGIVKGVVAQERHRSMLRAIRTGA